MTHDHDWVLATEESGHTRHFSADALPVRIGGVPTCDIVLENVSGALQIGLLDDVFFVQPGQNTDNLRVDGELLRGSRRLRDGDVIALDSARLTCRLTGERLTIAIAARVTAGDTAPPDLDELARASSAEIEIAPVVFNPAARAATADGGRRVSTPAVAVGVAFAILAVLGWFAFTAKSVQFVFDPPVGEFELPGTVFKFSLGNRYLLRSGTHAVTASLDGYYPLDTTVDVGQAPDQTMRLTLTKLPGLVTLDSEPEDGVEVRVDGELLGVTPLVDVEIVPGKHQVEFAAQRYLTEVRELDVAGGNERQALTASLTPNWAPLTVTTEPAGATVLVDGDDAGITPLNLELPAGERTIELRLAGYNAWQDRVTAVANTPLEIPTVKLSAADGRVQLSTVPPDAAVSVGDEFRGRTPLTLRLTPGRNHEITIAKPGYETVRRELSVAADSGRSLEIELTAQYGDVDVQTDPPNAEIWVDDRLAGTTPARLNLMAVGHEIEVRLAGYAVQSQQLTPRPGFSQALMFELEALDTSSGGGYSRVLTTYLGQELRLIPAGKFAMGSSRREQGRRSNEVLREVEISRAFYLGSREVTNAEFREFMAEHDSGTFGGQTLNDDEQPVAQLEWTDVAQFLNWLSVKDSLQPVYDSAIGSWAPTRPLRNGYRLPTEAEWAWAARVAGRDAPVVYPWGNELPPPDRSGNFADIAAQQILPTTLVTYNDGFPVAAPVGSFGANPVGIFDLGGNVAEWVQDFYAIDVSGEQAALVDPLGPDSGRAHVIRGSSWRSATVTDLRLAYRNSSESGREDVGFRSARNLE
jgi:formylglycine-generating enzyme required for sulfatase activity